jgi:hypothetical protein
MAAERPDGRAAEDPGMADTAKKLLVKPGDRVVLTGAGAGRDAAAIVGPLPEGATAATDGAADVAVLFAADEAAFRAMLPALRDRARNVRAAWIADPKLSSKAAGTLSRDVIRTVLEVSTDVTTVTQIALDDTWSAIRVRPKELVGH